MDFERRCVEIYGVLPVEISTNLKFLKIEKYGVSASFCTFNQYRNPKTRKYRTRQS